MGKGSTEMNDYQRAVEDAMICWDMVPIGNAKVDLNKLICIEIDFATEKCRKSLEEIMNLAHKMNNRLFFDLARLTLEELCKDTGSRSTTT